MLQASSSSDATPLVRLKVAQLALKVETQRPVLDETTGQLLDLAAGDASIGEIAGVLRDALSAWPCQQATAGVACQSPATQGFHVARRLALIGDDSVTSGRLPITFSTLNIDVKDECILTITDSLLHHHSKL